MLNEVFHFVKGLIIILSLMKLLLMRKKILIVALLFIYCSQAFAQLEKGSIYAGISSENRFHLFYKNFGVRPGLSYALDNHSLIGVSYNRFKSNTYDQFYSTATKGFDIQNGFGVSYSYFRYFKNSKKLGWYANANLDLNRIRNFNIKTTGETELTSRYRQTEISFRPGIFYTPSKHVMIVANFGGVSLVNYKGNIHAPFNFGSQLNVGAHINLDIFRKKK